jgi:hypothetical protein
MNSRIRSSFFLVATLLATQAVAADWSDTAMRAQPMLRAEYHF